MVEDREEWLCVVTEITAGMYPLGEEKGYAAAVALGKNLWTKNMTQNESVFFLKPFITQDSTKYKTGHGTTSVHGTHNKC